MPRLAQRVRERLRRLLGRRPVLAVDRAAWEGRAQEGELDFHRRDAKRATPEFDLHSEALFRHFGFEPDQFRGRTVVDLGAGSRLRTAFFRGAHLVAIEPLADRFRREIPWCDLDRAAEVHPVSAERRIDALVGRADAVLSVNVLDHCYDFEAIVRNVFAYLRPGGLAFLSFDSHDVTDEMHPLVLDEAICTDVFLRAGFAVRAATRGFGEARARIGSRGRDTYGHGDHCLNFWLEKPSGPAEG